jgi:hypothetical protein
MIYSLTLVDFLPQSSTNYSRFTYNWLSHSYVTLFHCHIGVGYTGHNKCGGGDDGHDSGLSEFILNYISLLLYLLQYAVS